MKKILVLLILCTAFAAPAFAEHFSCDIAIIGGGCGGCSAAIQAARLGADVFLIEDSEMVGGQMTSAAVCTLDDRTLTRTGIYKEFIDKVCKFYKSAGKNVNCCYWGGDTIAFEPARGAKILRSMLTEEGVKVILNAHPVSAKTANGKVTRAEFRAADGTKITVKAKAFIDATECGDFIALTPARYRAGNSLSPNIDEDRIIQDITWVAVVKKYPGGVPEKLKVRTKPQNYEKYINEFRYIVTKNGKKWPEGYPYNIVTHNEYRAIPDMANNLIVDGGEPATWANVTKTCLNWANDYPGGTYNDKLEHLSAGYLTNPASREEANRRAMEKTLCFLYYMQNELGMNDWSVSDEGYTKQLVDWKSDKALAPYAEILKLFPCRPYVRESRRIVGAKTVTVKDVIRDPQLKRTIKNKTDAIALGEYPIDMHSAIDTKYLEADLGETKDAIPSDWQYMKGGLFQVPAGALVPKNINGLLAAEKNISVSRAVNGSTRLQPITMLIGQAAGAIAAISVKHNSQLRDVITVRVQKELINSGVRLTLHRFDDIPEASPNWKYAEFAVLRDLVKPKSETCFGADQQLNFYDLRDIFRQLTRIDKQLSTNPFAKVTFGSAADWLEDYVSGTQYEKTLVPLIKTLRERGSEPFTKILAAGLIWKYSE